MADHDYFIESSLNKEEENHLKEYLRSCFPDHTRDENTTGFINLIAECIRMNQIQQNLPDILKYVRVVEMMLKTTQFRAEEYFMDLIPCLQVCVMGEHLCLRPSVDDHWVVRELAGSLLGDMCGRQSAVCDKIRNMLVGTFSEALSSRQETSSDSNLASIYGILFCTGKLGVDAILRVILPNLETIGAKLESVKRSTSNEGVIVKIEKTVLLQMNEAVRSTHLAPASSTEEAEERFGTYFGARIFACAQLNENKTVSSPIDPVTKTFKLKNSIGMLAVPSFEEMNRGVIISHTDATLTSRTVETEDSSMTSSNPPTVPDSLSTLGNTHGYVPPRIGKDDSSKITAGFPLTASTLETEDRPMRIMKPHTKLDSLSTLGNAHGCVPPRIGKDDSSKITEGFPLTASTLETEGRPMRIMKPHAKLDSLSTLGKTQGWVPPMLGKHSRSNITEGFSLDGSTPETEDGSMRILNPRMDLDSLGTVGNTEGWVPPRLENDVSSKTTEGFANPEDNHPVVDVDGNEFKRSGNMEENTEPVSFVVLENRCTNDADRTQQSEAQIAMQSSSNTVHSQQQKFIKIPPCRTTGSGARLSRMQVLLPRKQMRDLLLKSRAQGVMKKNLNKTTSCIGSWTKIQGNYKRENISKALLNRRSKFQTISVLKPFEWFPSLNPPDEDIINVSTPDVTKTTKATSQRKPTRTNRQRRNQLATRKVPLVAQPKKVRPRYETLSCEKKMLGRKQTLKHQDSPSRNVNSSSKRSGAGTRSANKSWKLKGDESQTKEMKIVLERLPRSLTLSLPEMSKSSRKSVRNKTPGDPPALGRTSSKSGTPSSQMLRSKRAATPEPLSMDHLVNSIETEDNHAHEASLITESSETVDRGRRNSKDDFTAEGSTTSPQDMLASALMSNTVPQEDLAGGSNRPFAANGLRTWIIMYTLTYPN